MDERLDVRRDWGTWRAAAVMLGACAALAVALAAGAAPNGPWVADAPAQDPSQVQQVPVQPSTPSEPKSLDESERSGKPERRRRIRNEGAEDELQAHSRPLLAFVDHRPCTTA